MTIEDTNAVDAIGTGGDSNDVVLLISDHLEWGDNSDDEHMYKLQEKINTYLRFYENGEIYDSRPEAKDKPIIIEIVGKHELSEKGKWFFNQAKSVVESAGLDLQFRLFR